MLVGHGCTTPHTVSDGGLAAGGVAADWYMD